MTNMTIMPHFITAKHRPLVLAMMLAVMPLPSLFSTPTNAAIPSQGAAEIVNILGTGEHREQSSSPWVPAKNAQGLNQGAFVRTGQASKMGILFADETQIRLNQNSVLQIKEVGRGKDSTTRVNLSSGRAWSQTKRPPGSSLYFDTPAATAAIRGTDWDIEVDEKGATLMTVFSGTVDFYNDLGTLTLKQNEAALAEPGKAPVRLALSNPKDRIQWVNALTVDPQRHLGTEINKPEWKQIVDAIYSGNLNAAAQALEASPLKGSVSHLLLSADLALVQGDFAKAEQVLNSGLKPGNQDPRLVAYIARIQMLTDRLDESELTLGRENVKINPDLLVARGDLSRRQGDTERALRDYEQAQTLSPKEDRAAAGMGSIYVEQEYGTPARAQLNTAIQLRPDIASYKGELGTLETWANQLEVADKAFTEALQLNPSDYVALTGLGLLRLKEGKQQDALDAFLRAGLMAPEYARAKTYTAVVYYQMGRHQDAISTLKQVHELDDKDPVPYLFLAQIYTDLFEPELAVQASRAAVERMPYLKSANQLANNQKGSSNLGASVAFFGLEEWALELAQQSAYPYWGGSHLFLSDRYPGEFNKNSELFQGFLTDPLSFGASPTFTSLLRKPGNYGIAGFTYDQEFYKLGTPSLTLNGLSHQGTPSAYFFKYNAVKGDFPLDTLVAINPPEPESLGEAATESDIWTLGYGLQPTADLGVFVYFNKFNLDLMDDNLVSNFIGAQPTAIRNRADQVAIGTSYRWTPTSQTWFKMGQSDTRLNVKGFPNRLNFPIEDSGMTFDGQFALGTSVNTLRKIQDYQMAHTVDLNPRTRLFAGAEYVRETQTAATAGLGLFTFRANGVDEPVDIAGFTSASDLNRSYTALAFGMKHNITPSWKLDGTVVANNLKQNVDGRTVFALVVNNRQIDLSTPIQSDDIKTTPRVGLVYQPNPNLTVRAAHQDWIRPLTTNTLQQIETAGIPIEDRLLKAGGRSKREVVQASYVMNDRTFLYAKVEQQDIHNPGDIASDTGTPMLPFLEELRSAQLVNLSSLDVVDMVSDFERGEMKLGAIGVNRILSRNWSAYSKYIRISSDASFTPATDATMRISNKEIPNLPEHTFAVGSTWASQSRFYLSGRMVYRSERFQDKENTKPLAQRWSTDLVGYWETRDKSWIIGAGALNLGGGRTDNEIARYVVDARYRF